MRCEPCSGAWPSCWERSASRWRPATATRAPTPRSTALISAVVFGAIALCAFIFDAAAVRLWFMRHRIGAVVIGGISAAAWL